MKKNNILAIVLLLIALIVLLVDIFIKKGEEVKENVKIVTNYSDFYTVNSCLQRFGGYISSKNVDDIYLVTSDNYKKKNKLNKENILDKYPMFDEDFMIFSKKMFYAIISGDITKYYVKVEYISNYTQTKIGEGYFIVYLNSKEGLFSIEPYSGEIFMRGDNNGE